MPAWAVHILERVAGEALIGRQRGTVHLKELEEGELGRGNSQCKASRLESPKHQVGSWSPEGVREAVRMVMGPWSLWKGLEWIQVWAGSLWLL